MRTSTSLRRTTALPTALENKSHATEGPLCHHCGEYRVNRVYGNLRRFKMGARVIDGQAWCWFCSRQCSGAHHSAIAIASPVRKAGHTIWTRDAQRRCLQRLVGACRDVMDASGKVDPKDFVRLMMHELMKARIQAADTGRRQVRREHEDERAIGA